jgi:hypothetical protein
MAELIAERWESCPVPNPYRHAPALAGTVHPAQTRQCRNTGSVNYAGEWGNRHAEPGQPTAVGANARPVGPALAQNDWLGATYQQRRSATSDMQNEADTCALGADRRHSLSVIRSQAQRDARSPITRS